MNRIAWNAVQKEYRVGTLAVHCGAARVYDVHYVQRIYLTNRDALGESMNVGEFR